MRGLKPEGKILQKEDRVSHLLQMRGLKHLIIMLCLEVSPVASFTDAWIETDFICNLTFRLRRIFYRCVD